MDVKDPSGRTWSVRLDIPAARRLRSSGVADLDELLTDASKLHAIAEFPDRLADVLAVVLFADLERYGMTDGEFGELLATSEGFIDDLADALVSELASFPRSPARRDALRRGYDLLTMLDEKRAEVLATTPADEAAAELLRTAEKLDSLGAASTTPSSTTSPTPTSATAPASHGES